MCTSRQTSQLTFTGVEVTLNVVDSNGNYRTIGTTTSDADGFFSLTGNQTSKANTLCTHHLAGSKAYWPSHAVTCFAVDPAAATPAPQEQQVVSSADQYILPGIIGILVAIVVVGIGLALLVTRKRS